MPSSIKLQVFPTNDSSLSKKLEDIYLHVPPLRAKASDRNSLRILRRLQFSFQDTCTMSILVCGKNSAKQPNCFFWGKIFWWMWVCQQQKKLIGEETGREEIRTENKKKEKLIEGRGRRGGGRGKGTQKGDEPKKVNPKRKEDGESLKRKRNNSRINEENVRKSTRPVHLPARYLDCENFYRKRIEISVFVFVSRGVKIGRNLVQL